MRTRRWFGLSVFALAAGSLVACAQILGFEDASSPAPAEDGGVDSATDAIPSSDVAPVDALSSVDVVSPSDGGVDAQCDVDAAGDDPSNCGACGHSCLGAACTQGRCDPVTLASGFVVPTAIALDVASVFVTDAYDSVTSVSKSGGASHTLTGSEGAGGLPQAVAVDDTDVYWSAYGSSVLRCPKSGCPDSGPVADYGASQPGALVLRGGLVIWAEQNSAAVQFAPIDGGTAARLVPDNLQVTGFASDPSALYAADIYDRHIVRIRDDGGVTVLGALPADSTRVAVGGGFVFAGTQTGPVVAVPVDGGVAVNLKPTNVRRTSAVATDGTSLYWVDEGIVDAGTPYSASCIYMCPLATCLAVPSTEVLCGEQGIIDLAVDDTALYWAAVGPALNDGVVKKLAKPPR